MDIVLTLFLPLSLAFIMFSLGLGLTVNDFTNVFARPKAFLIGFLTQVALLPLVAFALLLVFSQTPELAVGVMILAFSPGGVTSNILTKFAGGALALSISLTGIVSLLSVATVPFLVKWSAGYFMADAAPDINVTSLAIAMFLITTVPVAVGLTIRHFAANWAQKTEPLIFRIAAVLFVIIVIAALTINWALFVENLTILAPLLIVLNVVLLLGGLTIARLAGLGQRESVAIAIETGVQNSALGITVGSLIVEAANGLPPFSLPSGVYGITMYFVAAPFILWVRRKQS